MTEAPATGRLMRSAGTAATASSMLTNYECGVARLLPMKAHLGLDFVMSGVLMASPLFLPASERRYAAVPVALGVMGLITGLLSRTRSPLEGSSAGELAAGDPDFRSRPHLRTQLE